MIGRPSSEKPRDSRRAAEVVSHEIATRGGSGVIENSNTDFVKLDLKRLSYTSEVSKNIRNPRPCGVVQQEIINTAADTVAGGI